MVHIAERDTTKPKAPKKLEEFLNTWCAEQSSGGGGGGSRVRAAYGAAGRRRSVEGLISEAVNQCGELGWGTHEKQLPADAFTHAPTADDPVQAASGRAPRRRAGHLLEPACVAPRGRVRGHARRRHACALVDTAWRTHAGACGLGCLALPPASAVLSACAHASRRWW